MQLHLQPSIALKNRHIVLDFLRTMSDQDNLALHETGILAWGQIARYVASKEFFLGPDRFIGSQVVTR